MLSLEEDHNLLKLHTRPGEVEWTAAIQGCVHKAVLPRTRQRTGNRVGMVMDSVAGKSAFDAPYRKPSREL
jgi:redox-sensitive bicupin YhaK (pirin superfamily)